MVSKDAAIELESSDSESESEAGTSSGEYEDDKGAVNVNSPAEGTSLDPSITTHADTQPTSRAFNAPSPQGARLDIVDKTGAVDEATHVASENMEPSTPISASTPPSEGMEDLDLSKAPSPIPALESSDEAVFSLSHLGTTGKRQRLASPSIRVGSNGWNQCEITLETSNFVSTPERKRCVNHWNLEEIGTIPSRVADRTENVVLRVDPWHNIPTRPPTVWGTVSSQAENLPTRPTLDPGTSSVTAGQPNTFKPHPFVPPNGPRIQSHTSLICWYWYHKRHCRFESRDGQSSWCPYKHTLNAAHPEVNLPADITNHRACQLEHCPLRLKVQRMNDLNKPLLNNRTIEIDMAPTIKVEVDNSMDTSHTFFKEEYSSSPRDAITEARTTASIKGPKFNKFNTDGRAQQLPKLTGHARKRYKEQKQRIEEWQAQNGIKPDDQETRLENKRVSKEQRKARRRRKRIERVSATAALFKAEHDSLLALSGDTSKVCNVPHAQSDPNTIAIPAKRKKNRRNLLRGRRAQSLFERDLATDGRFETFDHVAELRCGTFQPLSGFSGTSVLLNTQGEKEMQQQDAEDAMEMAQSLNIPRHGNPHLDVQSYAKDNYGEQQEGEVKFRLMPKGDEPKLRKPGVLVDYGLPEGEARLDWDTDLVRRLFGEIA
ncbi:hypothetical protein BKA66DRAFT_219978 [Pyrenochaeta sp. MPI-SDFR-AT-0127]|nr:hypothetical protein BKA66DRAFT_219978 [Pyrenochaeta sp. MPI-SDFR-AT-0127]